MAIPFLIMIIYLSEELFIIFHDVLYPAFGVGSKAPGRKYLNKINFDKNRGGL